MDNNEDLGISGGGGSSFDLSDRMAKGVNNNGEVVEGAVIEGRIDDVLIDDPIDGEVKISKNKATGNYSHAEGSETTASGPTSHAEGLMTTASGPTSHAEGYNTTASDFASHAEGTTTTASGSQSHAEGNYSYAYGDQSHAEGSYYQYNLKLTGAANATEYTYSGILQNELKSDLLIFISNKPNQITSIDTSTNKITFASTLSGTSISNKLYTVYIPTQAQGKSAHAEGYATIAGKIGTESTYGAHAEGHLTYASGDSSHAEGCNTIASGNRSHAEGNYTFAFGDLSHTEGAGTNASGNQSHAEGFATTANHASQHVFGEFNVADDSTAAATVRGNYVEIVGNGTAETKRSNARTLDWSGNEKLAGSLTLGMGTSNEVTITATQLTALLALLNA